MSGRDVLIPKELLESVPIERAETIPSRWYVDPDFHRFDLDAVFARTWQYVGPESHVANAGETMVTTVADNPILVVRGSDGRLRAFYNVCRHRGGPLATEPTTCRVLQCQYHGWTYLLDGSLRGVPRFDRVELFDKKDYGLVELSVDTWQGLVFVNLQQGDPPAAHFLEGIVERIAPMSIAGKKFHKRVVYEVACNWKVYIDNYLEGYHLPYVHPELCTLLDYHQYITETFAHYSVQYSPFQGEENLYRAENGEAYYYFVFPNFMLNVLPGRLQTNLVRPIAYNRCEVIFDYFYDDVDSPTAREIIQEDLTYSDRVQQEDMEICEQVQQGLASRAYDRGRFSVECEQGVYHFQQLLKRAYRQSLAAA